MAATPLNILLITSDQQHHNTLGTINSSIRTPSLDRLCCEGTRFERAYCPNPTCTPTRASIITGLYPSQHGAWSLGTKLPADVPVVGDQLMAAGYDTTLIGKAHFQPTASRPGFESLECMPTLRDLDFWRHFHGPWYGFSHIEIARMHGYEHLVGQHYAAWMEEQGLANWQDFFMAFPPQSDPEKQRRLSSSRRWELPQAFHYTHWTGERTIARIDAAAASRTPFFAWASFHDPHPPYVVPAPWSDMYNPADMQPGELTPGEHDRNPPHFAMTQRRDGALRTYFAPDQAIHGAGCHVRSRETLQRNMATYYGMVSFIDQEVGRILECLDRHGLTENTLVVYTTDHGHFLGQHGLTAKAIHHYEDLLRVPFIVRLPGTVSANTLSDALVNLVDLAPTFLAAAGLEVPSRMTGRNQWPTWCGGPPVRDYSITENHHGTSRCHLRTFVTARHKLTVYRHGDDGELFDLMADPGEKNNLWHDAGAAGLKAELMHRFMQATLADEAMPMPRIAGA